MQSLEVRDDFHLVFVDVKVFTLDPRLVHILRREGAAVPRREIGGSPAAGVPLGCEIAVFPRTEEVEAWGDGLRQDDEASEALHRHDGACGDPRATAARAGPAHVTYRALISLAFVLKFTCAASGLQLVCKFRDNGDRGNWGRRKLQVAS